MRYTLCILLLANIVQAATVSDDTQFEMLDDFSGGLNTTAAPHKILKNMSPNMRNVLIDEKPGTLVTRAGFVTAGATTALQNVNFMFAFNKEDGDAEFLISDGSSVLSTKDFITFTTVKTSLNNTVNLQAAQIRNKVWLANGSDATFTWNGSSAVDLDGSGGTPDVPRGKYIKVFQERVFIFNILNENSALRFSELTSTDGISIAPDDPRAWPDTNQLNIGQGDGTVGTALFTYRGQLYVSKEDTIFTIFGTSVLDYFARKTDAQVGVVSADSVNKLDNLVYFLGKDGIYSFDGGSSLRISDNIIPDIEAIRKDTTNIQENVWTTQQDFVEGQFYGTTATASGLLTISQSSQTILDNLDTSDSDDIFDLSGPSTDTGFVTFSSQDFDPTYRGFIGAPNVSDFGGEFTYRILIRNKSGGSSTPAIRLTYRNEASNREIFNENVRSVTTNTSFTVVAIDPLQFISDNGPTELFFNGSEVRQGSMSIKVAVATGTNGVGYDIRFTTKAGRTFLMAATTGQFISEVTTITIISNWGDFDSVDETNEGSINYFIRTGTDTSAINNTSWQPFVPGGRIASDASENFVQWATTINSVQHVNPVNPPEIDEVTIGHIEGAGSQTRAFSQVRGNRYILSGATESTGNFPLQYVKSRITNPTPNAWMKFDNFFIKSYGEFEDNFYAGCSTAGAIFRLDFGTNDNGQAIDAFYETPELILGNNFVEKRLFEFLIDSQKAESTNLKLGLAIDGGSFSETEIDLDGTGRSLQSFHNIRNTFGQVFGKFFKFRFRNNQLDRTLDFHNFGILYQIREFRGQKQ